MHPYLAASLLLLLALAVSGDLRAHRIPNWLTLGGLALGLVLQFATGGGEALVGGLLGAAAGGLTLLPLWLLRGLAAGDAKLMAAVGAHLGPVGTIVATLATLIVGGLVALAVLMRRRGTPSTMAPTTAAPDRLTTDGFAYAPAIAAGTAFAVVVPMLHRALLS